MSIHYFAVDAARRAALWPAVMAAIVLLAGVPAHAASDAALRASLKADVGSVMVHGRPVPAAALRAFYAARGWRPVWTDADGLNARGKALAALLAGAARDGLRPEDYALPSIRRPVPDAPSHPIVPSAQAAPSAHRTPQLSRAADRARLEIAVAASLLRYAEDVRSGRVSSRQSEHARLLDDAAPNDTQLLREAAAVADPGAWFAGLAPASSDYLALRQALARYRAIAGRGGWRPLPPASRANDGRPAILAPGDRDPALVPALAARLAATGDVAADVAPSDVYSGALVAGVVRFQRRHGLAPDGKVGPQTRAALDVPVAMRIRQIEINMERWRWIGTRLGGPPDNAYVFVNLAAFRLTAMRGGLPRLSMRVVVGKTYRRTPVFSDRISYLVLNPFWNVPRRIATDEILPHLQRDPGWLAVKGYEVLPASGGAMSEGALDPLAIPWRRYGPDDFPFLIRQLPGPTNALGRVKFMFPNPYAVYMHDTPARGLFAHRVRTFSHGCIRVAKPVRLAAFLLDSPDWTAARVTDEIDAGETKVVRLPRPVPVYIAYLTAWVAPGGTLNFRNDVYRRDRPLAAAMFPGGA